MPRHRWNARVTWQPVKPLSLWSELHLVSRQWESLASSLRLSRRFTVRHTRAGRWHFSTRFSSTAIIPRTRGTVSAGDHLFPPPGFPGQEPGGDERQRLVVVPPLPGPHLIVGQARLPLGTLQAFFDAMLGLEHPRELRQLCVQRRVG